LIAPWPAEVKRKAHHAGGPAGATRVGRCGTIPSDPKYLQGLRDVTRRHGVVLIFDEVITGLRFSPGGVQEDGFFS
jgi:hypothetical protein